MINKFSMTFLIEMLCSRYVIFTLITISYSNSFIRCAHVVSMDIKIKDINILNILWCQFFASIGNMQVIVHFNNQKLSIEFKYKIDTSLNQGKIHLSIWFCCLRLAWFLNFIKQSNYYSTCFSLCSLTS